MPSKVATPPWDFSPVYDLLDVLKKTNQTDHTDPTDHIHNEFTNRRPSSPLPRLPSPSGFDPKVNVPQNLGDFNRLYEFLGLPINLFQERRPQIESINSDSSLSDQNNVSSESIHPKHSTPPSSLADDAIQFDDFIERRKVRWTDEVEGSDLAKRLGRSRILSPKIPHKPPDIKNSADFDSDTDFETFQRNPPGLIPSWVTPQKLWVPPRIPLPHIDPNTIRAIETLTVEEKRSKLLRKLKGKSLFGDSVNAIDELHIFVDCSNIIIGFSNALKAKRGIDIKQYTKQAPFSWHEFATILERARPVARRIVVGSNGSSHQNYDLKRPAYMLEAENCGYELNILDRVRKYKDPTPPKKKGGQGNGYATSGYSSSDGGRMKNLVPTEQAVDEILQMKMLESLVDAHEPATIVLASGDAAEAEYSGGFLKNVERALEKGWKVELVAWSAGLSREYRSRSFLQKWKDRFTIIELDDFSEELLALYTTPVIPLV